MIEQGSSEEIKFSILAATSWDPDVEEVGAVCTQLMREGAMILWADVTNSLTVTSVVGKVPFVDVKRASNYVFVCYWFEKQMDPLRERTLTVRAAKAVKMYPYQWTRLSTSHASVRTHKNRPTDSRSSVLQVWLSEHLCR